MKYVENPNGAPIKMWTDGVPVEESAMQQLRNLASLPFIHKHVAAMPDVHWGMGATVGSVIATKAAIIPAAVGVDIGCGMIATETTLTSHDLPDDLSALRSAIEAEIPHGRTDNGGLNDRGAWAEVPAGIGAIWNKELAHGFDDIVSLVPQLKQSNSVRHLGTLGTGNHFIEICLDLSDHVWFMLHSGSRGVGNKIGQTFIQKAKKDMERWFIQLPDEDLAYLIEGAENFEQYVLAVEWAQRYAELNRELMMIALAAVVRRVLDVPFGPRVTAVNCHHNYVARENHFGQNVWLTRKGAVRAREGDLGIIPGSMGARSFIVKGKGNRDSFQSCSHGAGRKMSRGEARRTFTVEDHALATQGVECRKDADVIDETPAAYKSIEAVMAAQTDLVDVVAELRQVLCVKG